MVSYAILVCVPKTFDWSRSLLLQCFFFYTKQDRACLNFLPCYLRDMEVNKIAHFKAKKYQSYQAFIKYFRLWNTFKCEGKKITQYGAKTIKHCCENYVAQCTPGLYGDYCFIILIFFLMNRELPHQRLNHKLIERPFLAVST